MNRFKIILFLFFAALITKAQDLHFSQFNDFPLNLNPSLTGTMDGSFRGGMIYRNQWNSVTVPFETTGLFTDLKLNPSFLNGKEIGVGIQFINDRSGSGSLVQNDFKLAFSYHHFLGFNSDKLITFGIDFGAFQKSYDFNELNFESQFIYSNADFAAVNNLESFQNSSFIQPDIGIGGAYSKFKSNKYSYTVGIAVQHINMPKHTFLSGTNDRLAPKFVLHGNGQINFNKRIDFAPSGIYMYQNQANYFMLGTDVLYNLGRQTVEKIDLKAGAYYRTGDALFLLVGINLDNWSMDFGYDINISGLSPASQYQGAFELSISYVNKVFRGNKSLKFVVPGNNLL